VKKKKTLLSCARVRREERRDPESLRSKEKPAGGGRRKLEKIYLPGGRRMERMKTRVGGTSSEEVKKGKRSLKSQKGEK